MNATLLSYVIVVDNLSVGECSHLQKALKSIEIADESLFLDFFLQVYVYISFQKTLRALGKVMGGNHAVGDSTVDFEIGYLGTDQGVEVNGKGASSQRVMSLALQFAGAGAAENEDKPAFHDEAMHLVEQFWHFGYLVDDNQGAGRLIFQCFIKNDRTATKPVLDAGVKEIEEDSIGKLLVQDGCLTRLACSEKEDTAIGLAA